MSAVRAVEEVRAWADSTLPVEVWTEQDDSHDVVLIDLSGTCCIDTYAVAAAAEAEYGQHARIILRDGPTLQEMTPTSDGSWTAEPLALDDLAAQLGVDPREVIP